MGVMVAYKFIFICLSFLRDARARSGMCAFGVSVLHPVLKQEKMIRVKIQRFSGNTGYGFFLCSIMSLSLSSALGPCGVLYLISSYA